MSAPKSVIFNILDHPERMQELMDATGKTRQEIEDLMKAMEDESFKNPADFTYVPKDTK